jgi:hypothetical protein
MKMKKIILSLFALMVLATACEKDFLDRMPLDQISSADYWNTANDLKLYVNQFYTMFSDGGAWSGGIYWFDDNSDNMIYRIYNTRLAGLRTVPTTGGWNYGRIRSLNYFFENYGKCQDPFDEYKQYVGEARFFRAYQYFGLVRNYGDVPWIGKTLTPESEELYTSRTPRNIVIDSIIADLDQAIALMKSGPNEGGTRLNKEIAQLFKARVCLYEGTWEKYHAGDPFGVSGSDGTKYLQLAADAANDLINSGKYHVFSTGDHEWDYWHLFNQVDYSGNPEIMLWKKYDADLDMTHNHQRYLPRIGGGRGITKNLAGAYLCTDGQPISVSPLYQGDDSLTAEATNRDLRFRQTIYTRGFPMEIVDGDTTKKFIHADIDQPGESKCPTGYQLCKGALPDPAQYYAGWVGTTGSPIFRYAEGLLIYAEAKAELGTLTQEDVDKTINVLRDRVGTAHLDISNIANDPNWFFPTLSPIINEVRRERQVELACEGFRWDDIARWAAADELIVGKRFLGAKFNSTDYPELNPDDYILTPEGYIDFLKNQLPDGYGFRIDRDYLSPISTEELTLNPNLVQNPGW